MFELDLGKTYFLQNLPFFPNSMQVKFYMDCKYLHELNWEKMVNFVENMFCQGLIGTNYFLKENFIEKIEGILSD